MPSDFFNATQAQFERDWDNAIDTSEWATVQVSPRKVLVLKRPEVKGRGIQGDMRVPDHMTVVATCPNNYVAHNYIRAEIRKAEEAKAHGSPSDSNKK